MFDNIRKYGFFQGFVLAHIPRTYARWKIRWFKFFNYFGGGCSGR